MRKFLLSSSLTLAVLFLASTTYAISHLGEAWVDWTSLKFTGVPVTAVTEAFQRHEISINSSTLVGEVFRDWRDHTANHTVPQFATLLNSADANRLYASINTFGSNDGSIYSYTAVERDGSFTPLKTGDLTISIDYTLRQSGVPSSQDNFSSESAVILDFYRGDRATVTNFSGDSMQTGTVSRTAPVEKGESLFFGVSVGVNTFSVPLPDMLWPTLAGMIGIAFLAEWRRRQTSLTR